MSPCKYVSIPKPFVGRNTHMDGTLVKVPNNWNSLKAIRRAGQPADLNSSYQALPDAHSVGPTGSFPP